MAHVPHVYVPAPWTSSELDLPSDTVHHLTKVLRRRDGASISYTDGAGTRGAGVLAGNRLVRGDEHREPPPPRRLTLVVAPPRSADRARFLVEKTGELGVARLGWLQSAYGEGRPPPLSKAERWMVGALEQSRSVWLTELVGTLGWDDLDSDCFLADATGVEWSAIASRLGADPTIVVGPEGGFHPDELARNPNRVALSDRVLRVETAAVAAAVLTLCLPDSGTKDSVGA